MGFSQRPRASRSRLAVERLEDRTTPAGLLADALADVAVTGYAADRVNVVTVAEVESSAYRAELAAAPFAAKVEHIGFGIYSVTLAGGTDVTAAARYYSDRPGVVSAAADTVFQLQVTPNDPSYGSLYGLSKIGAPTAWNTSTGNGNFVVAVIDTGVDYTHPDLAANLWHNPADPPDGLDNDGNGLVDDYYGADFANGDGDPFDDNEHGTHVAGTIGAVGNNGVGVAGVNWSVKIMALKFLTASGSGATSAAVKCLDYATTHGVKVSNNSWGGGGADSTLAAAINRARNAGHIVVAAAGNSNQNIDVTPSYPASYIGGQYNYDNVVTVAATDANDQRASFSSYGANNVLLAAPGVGILSTVPGGGYASFSGTSMATPHVTGAIALYWSANPTLTYQQVIAKLTSSVTPLSNLTGVVRSGGRLNVGNMFVGSPPVVPPPPTFDSGPRVTTAAFAGTAAGNLTKVRFTFTEAVTAGTFTVGDIVSITGPAGAISTTAGVAVTAVGPTQYDVTFPAQTAAGTYTVVIGPAIADLLGNLMNQDNDTTNGENPADRYTATTTLGATPTTRTYTNATVKTIADLGTVTSTVTVPDDFIPTDVNVKLNVAHTYDGDLRITLIRPNGTAIVLSNRRGGSGDNYTNTTFDTQAGTAVTAGAAPFSGSYRPEGSLSGANGVTAKGVWTLKVEDLASQDVGKLNSWSLVLTGNTAGAFAERAFGFRDPVTMADDLPAVTAGVAVEPAAMSAAVAAPARFAWLADEARPVVVAEAPPRRAARPVLAADEFAYTAAPLVVR